MSDEDLQACSRLKERVVLLTEQKASTERLPSSPTSEPKPRGTNLVHYILASSLLVAGIGAGAIGLLAGILTRNAGLGIILAGLGFVLFGVAVVWLVWLFLSTRRATPRPVIPAETKPDLNLQLAEAEAAFADRLRALGCEDWTDYEAKRKQLQSALASRDNIQGRLDGLLPAGQTVETLETARKAASHERRDWEEKLSSPGAQRAAKMTPLEYQSLSTEITRLVKEQEALEAEAVLKNAQVAAAKVTREDLLVAEERLAALEQEIEHTRERQEVYELAWQTLQTAREKTLVRARDRLAPLAGEYMKALTIGRYSELAVDSDLNVTIKSPDKAALNLVRPAELSKGTQDQLYLAMRLALIDLLYPSAKPPLFLDDPFVKFDVPRQRAAIGLCQTIAGQRQVLLFTCRSDYDEAGRLIEIGERTG